MDMWVVVDILAIRINVTVDIYNTCSCVDIEFLIRWVDV